MSEQVLDRPDALTYSDVLQQLPPGINQDFRGHVERLAATEATAEGKLVDFAEGEEAHLQETYHARAEISPEHHERHVEIAEPAVPDIRERPRDEQDLIGEVFEIGEEAITNQTVEAKLEKSEGPFGEEKMQELCESIEQRSRSEMNGYGADRNRKIDEAERKTIRTIATQLLEHGADGNAIKDLVRTHADVEVFQDAVERAQADPGRAESYKEGLGLLAQLSKQKELLASYKPAEGDFTGNGLLNNVLLYPQFYREAITVIDSGLQTALESGYPGEQIISTTLHIFSKYAGNLGNVYGHNGKEVYADYLDSNFRAMSLLGDAGLELQALTTQREVESDRFVSELSSKISRGERIDIVSFREDIATARDSLTGLKKESPQVYEALLERTEVGIIGDAQLVGGYARMAQELAKRQKFINSLDYFNFARDTPLKAVMGRVGYCLDYATNTFPEGAFSALDDLEQVLKAEPRLDRRRLGDQFIGQRDGEHARALKELLLSDEVHTMLSDDTLQGELNNALPMMNTLLGKFDLARAASAFSAIEGSSQGWLNDIIRAEARLKESGPNGNEAVGKFYELAPSLLSRKDKDDNPYDSPDMIALALSPLGRDDGRYAESLDWFLSDKLPVAAIDSILHFRPQAQENGIEDRPAAIYEWIHKSPEKVEELSHYYLENYFSEKLWRHRNSGLFADKIEPDKIPALIERMGELADRSAEDFRIFININPEALRSVAGMGGDIKSLYDRGELDLSKGHFSNSNLQYKFHRSGIEVAMGIRSMGDSAEHPIYGSCGYAGNGVPSGATGYGDIMLSFKLTPELDARTTYSPEDSFHGPYRLTPRDAQIARLIKSARGQGYVDTNDYVETQISGGVNLNAVDSIYVPTAEVAENVKSYLPTDLQNKVIVRPAAGNYNSLREEQIYRSVVDSGGGVPLAPALF